MKIRVTFTLDVDPERWSREYGIDPGSAAVRQDVRDYFEGFASDQLECLGLAVDSVTAR